MTTLYEGMFLIDNDAVRASWKDAKAHVVELLAKHGGSLTCGRRWAERQLAYPIARKNRATFLLAYYEIDADGIVPFLRELEIDETVLRHLTTKVDAIPEGELELAAAEDADDFAVPEPPDDDTVDEPPPRYDPSDEEGRPRTDSKPAATPGTSASADATAAKPASTEEAPASADATAAKPAATEEAPASADATDAGESSETKTETKTETTEAEAAPEPALAATDTEEKKEA